MPRDRNISRLSVLVSVSIALASLLTVRLWFLQAIDSKGLQDRVSEVRTRTEVEPAEIVMPPEAETQLVPL